MQIWDTSVVAPNEGFAYWRDSVTQAYLPLEPESTSRETFRGRIVRNGRADFMVSRVISQQSRVIRTRTGIARRQNNNFFANLILSGNVAVQQGSSYAEASAGDIVLVDTDSPFALDFAAGVDLICVSFKGSCVRQLPHKTGTSPSLLIQPNGAGALASSYIAGLARDLNEVHHFVDLAIEQFPILIARAASPTVVRRSQSEDLAARVRQLIDAEIDNPDLGAKRVSAVLGVSRTAIYEAMGESGRTLAGYIREKRLNASMQDIATSDPRKLSIGAIAQRWGFRDASSFTRAFKRVTGRTPAQFRRQPTP